MKKTPSLFLTIVLIVCAFFYTSCKKEVSLDKQDSWIQIIHFPSKVKPIMILEYKDAFRVDTFFQSGDTLFNTIEPDSIGIISILSHAGDPLFAFRMNTDMELLLEYHKDRIVIKSNDSLNIRLANYYKDERLFVDKFISFSDSLKKKKISVDSLSVVWMRKYTVIDSLWQEKALSFLKENTNDIVAILPIQSYLMRVDNAKFRYSVQPLVKSLSDYRLVKAITND